MIAKCWPFDFLINQIMGITVHFLCCPICRCTCVSLRLIFFIYKSVHIDSSHKIVFFSIPDYFLSIPFQFQCFLHGKFWKYQYRQTSSYSTVDKISRKPRAVHSLKGEVLKMLQNMFKSYGRRVNSPGFMTWNPGSDF